MKVDASISTTFIFKGVDEQKTKVIASQSEE